MKTLKWIGLTILAIVVLILAASFLSPSEYKVERSIVVKQNAESVYPLIGTWQGFKQWSPWNDLDPNMVTTIEGEDGTVGSKYSWKGNDSVGTGEMIFTEVTKGKSVRYDLFFKEPFESKAKNEMMLEPQESGVKVTWTMQSAMQRPMNLMMLFMDMEGMIGKDFDKGLEKIKALSEAQANQFMAEERMMPATKLLYIKGSVKVEEVNQATKAAYEELYRFTGMTALVVTGAPWAIYEQWDGKQAVIQWALPVATLPDRISGKIEKMEKPETLTLMAVYKGGYDGMESFYNTFDTYLQSKGYTAAGGPIEKYITDPEKTKDTAAWITHVYYPVMKQPLP